MLKKCSFTLHFFAIVLLVLFSACSHNANNNNGQVFSIAAPEWVNGASLGNSFYAVGVAGYDKELKQTINNAEQDAKNNLKTMVQGALEEFVDANLQKFNDAKKDEFSKRLENIVSQTANGIDYNNFARRDEVWIDPETNKMYVFMVVDNNFVLDVFSKQANQIKEKYNYDVEFGEFVDEIITGFNGYKFVYKKKEQTITMNSGRQKVNNFNNSTTSNEKSKVEKTDNIADLIDEFE